MIRHHVKKRKGLFSPVGMTDVPVKMDSFTGNRKVEIEYENGETETLQDNIYTSRKPHAKQKMMWMGKTILELKSTKEKVSEQPKRPELSTEDYDVMIAQYEQDVLSAMTRGATENSQNFRI